MKVRESKLTEQKRNITAWLLKKGLLPPSGQRAYLLNFGPLQNTLT